MPHTHPGRDAAVSARALRTALAAALALGTLAAAAPADAQSSSRLALRSARSAGHASAPVRTASRREHVVTEGETLWSIARRNDVSVDALREANDLSGATIRPGQALRIPRPSSSTASSSSSSSRAARSRPRRHTVERGESLWEIARRYDLSVDALQDANDLDDVTIQPGQELRIPGAAAAAARVAAAEPRAAKREEGREVRRARPSRTAERERGEEERSERGERSERTASRPARASASSAAREERTASAAAPAREEREARSEEEKGERGSPSETMRASRLVIPVAGISASRLRNSYDDARSGGRIHDAIDIHAPKGTPVLAVADGRVLRFHQGSRGGNSLYLLGEDGRTRYYYAHLDGYAEGLEEGDEVKRGQVLGFVGDTGNAQPGDYHLHFSIAILSDTRHWWQGRNVNPYPLLRNGETEQVAER